MPTFSEALDRFKEDGFFGLDTTELYTEQIERLQMCTRFLSVDRAEIAFYQFHLNHVQFVPGYLPRPERVMDGAVVEHHEQRDWHPGIPDLALLQMARSANEFNMGLRFTDPNIRSPERMLGYVLSDLLSQVNRWDSIKIDGVYFFRDNEAPDYLNADFHNDLLDKLTKQAGTSLKELSLKPFTLSKSLTALVNFLTQNTSLEILHLELSDPTRDEWLGFVRALAMCPALKSLNLANTLFDEDAYWALSRLLDEDYRIEAIDIAAPIGNWVLIEAYNRLNQRVSKPGRVRFKEERLSLEALLELAIQTLVEREAIQLKQPGYRLGDREENKQTLLMRRVDFLLSDQGTLAITETEKVTWLKGAYVLPAVYLNHQEYLKEFFAFFQLHLDKLVREDTNTVGYLLLEKAFEVKDTHIIQRLLESKADLFESPPEGIGKPFLVRLFETEGPWQERVIAHLKKDLNILVPAVKILSPYSDVEPICNSLKAHLNAYFSILEGRKKQPKLLRLLNGIMPNFQDRQEECAQSFHNLVWYIKVATDDAVAKKVSYDSLFEAQEILEQLLEDSRQANRGFLGRSKLHDDLLRFGKELNKQLRLHQRELYYHEKNNSILYLTDGRGQDNAELEATKTALVQERERHAKEREEMKEKIEQLERLMRAQNRSQNQPSEETAPQDQERPESSTHFFARR